MYCAITCLNVLYLFHHFEDRVFNPQEEVHVHEGRNLRVMGLEEFMDEFGFDPRTAENEDEETDADKAHEAPDGYCTSGMELGLDDRSVSGSFGCSEAELFENGYK